jgi:hypothetical protein
MATASHDLQHSLERRKEIEISVLGRKSGKWIPRPVWFVFEGETLSLIPVEGSGTQWYKNLLGHPRIRISAGKSDGEFDATAVKDEKTVSTTAEMFRDKYGAADIKKYFSKFDVAVAVKIA